MRRNCFSGSFNKAAYKGRYDDFSAHIAHKVRAQQTLDSNISNWWSSSENLRKILILCGKSRRNGGDRARLGAGDKQKRRETIRFSRRFSDGRHTPSCALLWPREMAPPYWPSILCSIKIQTVICHKLWFDRQNERGATQHAIRYNKLRKLKTA